MTATYDANRWRDDHPPAFCVAYCAWLETHGVAKELTYRVEHHLIDAPLIRVFQIDKDDRGRTYLDQATNDVAVRDPFDVLIRTPPPRPEDYR